MKVVEEVRTNPKVFYGYANKFRKATNKIGSLKQGHIYVDNPKKMASILSQQYKTAFSTPRPNPAPSLKLPNFGIALEDRGIKDIDIKEAADEMN